MTEYARTVVARKWHWCDDPTDGRHQIPVGAPYARLVAFPGGDVNSGTRPWVMYLCADCYCRYGKPMPPPRKKP